MNIHLTFYCRRLRPDARIISSAGPGRDMNLPHQAGADLAMAIISLVTIAVKNLLRSRKIPMISEGFNLVGARLNPKLENKASIHIGTREDTVRGVVAVKRENCFCVDADPEIVLLPGDTLVSIGTARSEKTIAGKNTLRFPDEGKMVLPHPCEAENANGPGGRNVL